MKILHVAPFYYPVERGGERHVRRVSEHLAARGHDVHVLTSDVASDPAAAHREIRSLPREEVIGGVSVRRIPVTSSTLHGALTTWHNLRGGHRSLSLLFTNGGVEMICGEPRNFGMVRSVLHASVDVVVSWNWYYPAAYHVYLARKLKRFQLIGVPLFHTEDPWVQRAIYDRMIQACDGMITNTVHEAEYIRNRVPSARRLAAIGAGVDPDAFRNPDGEQFRARHNLGHTPVVGFVGSISVQKGADTLLQAMPAVWKSNPDVRVVLAGYPATTFSKIDTLYRALPSSERERVLLLPNFPEDEKADLYAALDVFVLPSTGESFGISYLEAWMCGKPVIGSRIGSTACVIADGVDGLLASPRDPEDLARALRTLLGDPERCRQMGAQGHAKTMKHFTWERIAERFEQFCAGIPIGRQIPERP